MKQTHVIDDDGGGLDGEAIRRRAAARGPLTKQEAVELSDLDTWQLILEDGLTTTANVSKISGHGVGLSSVRRAVEALGGQLPIDSRPGECTTFKFTLPKENLLE